MLHRPTLVMYICNQSARGPVYFQQSLWVYIMCFSMFCPIKKACTYHDTVNSYLNSVQCSNAHCSFRLEHKQKYMSNDVWFESKLVTVWCRMLRQHFSRWCPFSALRQHTLYCEALQFWPHSFSPKIKWLFNQ